MPKTKEPNAEYAVSKKDKKKVIKYPATLQKREKIKLILSLAGNVQWNGNLSQSRKTGTF